MIPFFSADMRGSLNSQHERSWHNITIDKLINELAFENKLTAVVAEVFKNEVIRHLDQTNETTVNLLIRLAETYGAIATVKEGKLLFLKAGNATTASGKPLPTRVIHRQSGDGHRFSITESENYTAVRAYWHNHDNGKKGEVIIDENSQVKRINPKTQKGHLSKSKRHQFIQTKPVETDVDKMKTLRHVYKYQSTALTAAQSAYSKLKRGVATFSIHLAVGRAELFPEIPCVVRGFKAEIDSNQWLITQVTHNITDNGFTTSVELELKPEECEECVGKKAV